MPNRLQPSGEAPCNHKQQKKKNKQNRITMVSHKSIVIKVASDRPSSKMSSWNRQSMLTVQQPILIITGQDQLHNHKKEQKTSDQCRVHCVRFKVFSAPFKGSKTGITVFLLVISSSTPTLNRSKTRKSLRQLWNLSDLPINVKELTWSPQRTISLS